MAGETNPREPAAAYFRRVHASGGPAPVSDILLHQPTAETRLAPLVVDVEAESEILPQLPAVGTIPGYHRSPASSSRAGPSSGRQSSDNDDGASEEVICLDDTPPRAASTSRSQSGSRKLRRLNDSTPVIVVSDEEEDDVEPVPPTIPDIVPEVLPHMRRATRVDSVASSRVTRARARETDRSRRHRVAARSSPPFTSNRLAGSSARDMPALNTRSSQTRVPHYFTSTSAPSRQTRASDDTPALNTRSSHVRVPSYSASRFMAPPQARNPADQRTPAPAANESPRFAALLNTFGFARAAGRRGGGSGSARRSFAPGRSFHAVQFTSNHPRFRARIAERDLLHQIVHHFAQHGGTVGVEFRYVNDQSLDYESLVRLDEQLMRQRNAAPKEKIESLATRLATNEDLDTRCVVCMCDVELNEELRILPCSHKYHKKCIDEWLTYNGCCPVDKQRICDYQSTRPNETS